jgi:hypothetical protein
VIKVNNGRNVNFTLQLISTAVNETISHLNYSDIFYYYFGEPLKSFSKPFFAVEDNYLIIANSPGVIRNFLADYESERFLSFTPEFKQYDQLLANQSNILYFIHTNNSKNRAYSVLKPKYASLLLDKDYQLKNFYGLSYQWSGEGDHFFSNLYLSYPLLDSVLVNKEK